MSVSKFLANLIFKKSVQKQTGIMKTINPMEKKLAENKAKFALQQIQKNNNIDINNLSANDLEILAENIVNPIKNATQTPVKSADILDFRYKRSFAEELADASKKGDFNRMTGIMKVDPKFKEVMESLKASKAADAAKAKMIGPKKLIPDRDVIPYQSPEVQKLNFADKLKRAGLTEQEYMDNIVKKGYNVDDAIYAGDFYGDTTDQIIKNANTKGAPVAFAGGGVAGLLGERTGYEGGLRVDAPNLRILELMLNEKMSYEDALKEFEMREKQRPYIEERMGTGPGPILEAASGGIARQNFKMGKRAFLKLLGGVGAGIAGLKSGLLGLGGKQATKKAVTETVKSAGSGAPPPYFFKLVDKIKTLGDDVTPSYAVKDRQKVTKYKDYELTEDVTTGEKTIQRMKIDDDLKYDASEYYGKPVGEDVYMSYKPGKGQMDETMKGKTPPDEYIEDTSLIRSDKPAEGEIMQTVDGVPNDILEEVGETIVKKADGGRIGYAVGKKVIGKGIMAGINKLFGKGTMTTADKLKRPQKALDREMFKKADDRLNDKRQMNKDELEDFEIEIGDNIEAYDFDGTVGDAKRIIKDIKDYEAEMFAEYKSIGGSKRLGGPKDAMADAIDNASPGYTGDLKYDAQLVADDLAEKMFKVEYDDLTQAQQMDLYDKAYTALSKNQQGFKQMQKLSKPTNTLEGIKNTGTIDISNPNVADEFTRFMKESNPKGFKDIEQKIKLESFDPKKTKGNADGGRIGLSTGGLARMLGE